MLLPCALFVHKIVITVSLPMSTPLDRYNRAREIRELLERQPRRRRWRTPIPPALGQRGRAQHPALADVEATASTTALKQNRQALTG